MLLREALARPHLRLTLLTGGDALDRPISRVYVTDLPDPRRYLSGGELVLTGLMWRRRPVDSEAFVAACAAAGVAAIGAGDAAYGRVPADLVRACQRHGLPLFGVPVEVSFRDVLEEINPSIWARRASGLATLLGRQRGLVAAMAGGARLVDLLPPVAADLGLVCWVLTPAGRLVAGTGSLPDPARRQLVVAFLAASRLPARVAVDGWVCQVRAVTGRPEHRLASWLLAHAEADGAGGTAPDPPDAEVTADAAAELVSLAGLERAHVDETNRLQRRLADQLAAALAGGDPAELRARLLACGLAPDGIFLVVAARLTGLPTPAELAVAVCADLLRTLDVPAAVGAIGATGAGSGATGAGVAEPAELVLAVLTVGPTQVPTLLERLREALTGLGPGLGTGRLAVGVSRPVATLDGLAGAVAEARHALGTAATATAATATSTGTAAAGTGTGTGSRVNGGAAGDRTRLVYSGELASHLLLLAGLPQDARRAFRERLLGPLVEYDRVHSADLVRTLDTFLGCSGSWSRCAEALHVHVNTLRYRISRIEQLSGRDLTRFEDRVDFFLALRLPG